MQNKNTLKTIVIGSFVLLILGAWANWVYQRNQFLYSVMDCTEDNSKQEYIRCANIVRSGYANVGR